MVGVILRKNWAFGGLVLTPPKLADTFKIHGEVVEHNYINNSEYLTQHDDQGSLPSCAANTLCQIIEFNIWRKKHIRRDLDFVKLYKEAKQIDGLPSAPGTTFDAVFQAAKNLEYLPKDAKMYTLRNGFEVRMAIVEFGVCALGFKLINEWHLVNESNIMIQYERGKSEILNSGHAVVGCAYKKGEWYGIQNHWRGWGKSGFGQVSSDLFDDTFFGGIAIDFDIMGYFNL